MGGDGSGRKPDMIKMAHDQASIRTNAPTLGFEIPNYSGLQAVKKTDSSIISSQWTTSGSTIYYTGGNVGIGTTGPSQKLHVVGDALITGSLRDTNNNIYLVPEARASAVNYLTIRNGEAGVNVGFIATGADSVINTIIRPKGATAYTLLNDVGGTSLLAMAGSVLSTSAGDMTFKTAVNGTTVMTLQATTGNVGIGTTSPTYPLHVSGAIVGVSISGSTYYGLPAETDPVFMSLSGSLPYVLNSLSGAWNTHIADASDPHGTTLTQTGISVTTLSGTTVVSTGDTTVSGTAVVRNIVIGTEAAPTASTYTTGTLYLKYTA